MRNLRRSSSDISFLRLLSSLPPKVEAWWYYRFLTHDSCNSISCWDWRPLSLNSLSKTHLNTIKLSEKQKHFFLGDYLNTGNMWGLLPRQDRLEVVSCYSRWCLLLRFSQSWFSQLGCGLPRTVRVSPVFCTLSTSGWSKSYWMSLGFVFLNASITFKYNLCWHV